MLGAVFALSLSCAAPSADDSNTAVTVAREPVHSEEELDRARATFESLRRYQDQLRVPFFEYPEANNISELMGKIPQHQFGSGTPAPLSLFDGWGNEFRARSSEVGYEIRSAGSDGIFEDSAPEEDVKGLHRDIVLINGKFVQIPEPSLILPTPTPTPSIDIEKARATLNNMREIMVACETYGVDNGEYPSAKGVEELARLAPDYIGVLPTTDFWGNTIEVFSSPNGYEIRSFGRDGKRDTAPPSGPMSNYDADIVITDGGLAQYPDI